MMTGLTRTKNPLLKKISNNICNNRRLSEEDALFLLELNSPEDKEVLHQLADYKRAQTVGNIVYFSSTLYLYPTNLCDFSCTFCSFYAKPGDPHAWLHQPETLVEQIRGVKQPITEVHIVGGCYPECNLDYYIKLFSLIRKNFPELHIKALSAIEYDYLSNLHKIPVGNILHQLKLAGLDSIPGGGSEILVDDIRKKISPQRLSSQEFLNIHQEAHELGIPSNVTILVHHCEQSEDIIEHLSKIRNLQDRTKGFKTLAPLKYAQHNNALSRVIHKQESSHVDFDNLFAVARLYLDNVPNLKALWNYLGIDLALQMLSCGANDLSSTHLEEKVFKMASKEAPIKMDIEGLSYLIRKLNKTPCLTCSKTV